MSNFLEQLPRPFLALAPLYDVTDTVFRRIIADCAPPDLYFTEFVNADGLQSAGRSKIDFRLKFTEREKPLIAQIWGKNPENFYKTAKQIVDGSLAREVNFPRETDFDEMQGGSENRTSRTNSTVSENRKQTTQQFVKSRSSVSGSDRKQDSAICFSGIDINMGCPDKAVLKNGCCAALINDHGLAGEIVKATQQGAAGKVPVSVKTRIGFREFDPSWLEFVLSHNLAMLSVHLRTVREMSKVPAHWEYMTQIRKLRDQISPDTLIIGNGDVADNLQGTSLYKQHGIDGAMIGRGVFNDPFVFSRNSPWLQMTPAEKIALYKKHVELFENTWQNNERPIITLNKFCKIYVNGFDGAKELRSQLMNCQTIAELKTKLQNA